MRHRVNIEAVCKGFGVLAVTVAAFCTMSVSSVHAQVAWHIEVDGIGPNEKPTYKILNDTPEKRTCTFSWFYPAHRAKTLRVCPGDTVQWVAKTTQTKNDLFIYHENSVFDGSSSPQGFHASDSKETDPVTITQNSNLKGSHKYYVALFDGVNMRLYIEDPKIIIGSGGKHGGGRPKKDATSK